MKFEMKKSHIAKAVALVLSGAAITTVHAAPVFITDGMGGTAATIADAGYFQPGGVGLSYKGFEFIDWDTQASNYTLSFGTGPVTTYNAYSEAGFSFPAGPTNPLSAIAIGPLGGVLEISANFGSGGSGWDFTQTVQITSPGHVAVTVRLSNNTGTDAENVRWGVGFDPDQGRNFGLGLNSTDNVINAQGLGSSVTASYGDLSITLADTTKGTPTDVAAYIDSTCCDPVDPGVMFAAAPGQTAGYTASGDYSINLAYLLGNIADGHSATIGYEYIMAVPEPETYAMLLAGLGLIGFSARRRIGA